ncbi:fumarylacetoacetate hydrolase family protein [Zhongshania borealis]|uniref:Fumarylacetoacetate hydrolase family protein n=1 Tax=Zhongshania borealis TaxID=889488 RepID=A0ABP7X262_9GAMM
MSLTNQQRLELSQELFDAMTTCTSILPFTERFPDISIDDAYHISRAFIQARLDKNGETIIGKKIGVTSASVQKMLGVFQPDFGFLTSAMALPNGTEIDIENVLVQPQVEAEIAFQLKSDLQGPGVSEQDVLAATEYIIPCFEIVDSRITNWHIKIQDTIADNASCGFYALGDERIDPAGIDLANLKIVMHKNGDFVSEGLGSAVQGNPLTAVAWLANTLGEFGTSFKAGEIILSGSVVPLEPAKAGDKFTMELIGYGSTNISFKQKAR